jgi:Na+/H+ antiporter NhaD/arsenite permease-like protein
LDAYLPAVVALLIFAIPASVTQQRFSPIAPDPKPGIQIDWVRVVIVFVILFVVVAANITANLHFPALPSAVPLIGLALWIALLLTALIRAPDWDVVPEAFRGTIFLLALVFSATMMPVEKLPPASWPSTFGVGLLSAVFDNIPLTALALKQGGYDWGFLAYAVGFGGSMIWFGSSAGVAVASMFPEARSVGAWLRHGWTIGLAYVVAFFVMLVMLGWQADPDHKDTAHRLPFAGSRS